MNILILKDVPGEIKTEKMTYNIQEIGLAIALRKKGHSADIMCCSDDGTYHERQVTIDDQSLKIFSVRAIKKFRNGIPLNVDHILEKYDILHVSEYNELYTWHLAKKYSNKMICYHGPYFSRFNKNYNRMARFFDFIFLSRYKKFNTQFITKSDLAADYLKRKGLKNVEAIGVGINAGFLSSNTNESLPIINEIKSEKKLKLLYIGTIERRRNTLFILDIMNELNKKGVAHNLILIGKYNDKSYQKEFEEKIEKLHLQKQIEYIPRMEQKYLGQVYQNCDIFLLPTIYDIYGMVLLEAMYFGVPVLTTINGGSNMMIADGKNGFVFDDFDVKKWSCCIERLSKDSQTVKNIGMNAHETIVNKFTWDKLAEKFIDVYKRKIQLG